MYIFFFGFLKSIGRQKIWLCQFLTDRVINSFSVLEYKAVSERCFRNEKKVSILKTGRENFIEKSLYHVSHFFWLFVLHVGMWKISTQATFTHGSVFEKQNLHLLISRPYL